MFFAWKTFSNGDLTRTTENFATEKCYYYDKKLLHRGIEFSLTHSLTHFTNITLFLCRTELPKVIGFIGKERKRSDILHVCLSICDLLVDSTRWKANKAFNSHIFIGGYHLVASVKGNLKSRIWWVSPTCYMWYLKLCCFEGYLI